MVLSREEKKNIALEDGSRINQLYISIDQEFLEAVQGYGFFHTLKQSE